MPRLWRRERGGLSFGVFVSGFCLETGLQRGEEEWYVGDGISSALGLTLEAFLRYPAMPVGAGTSSGTSINEWAGKEGLARRGILG